MEQEGQAVAAEAHGDVSSPILEVPTGGAPPESGICRGAGGSRADPYDASARPQRRRRHSPPHFRVPAARPEFPLRLLAPV
ncbi:hypothetical protein G6F57_023168 [Rhizopus arrhizus]|nr:hypothetical protein G6F57_023168 [Rhizopus arrhizus]